jgi:hypothetical protein
VIDRPDDERDRLQLSTPKEDQIRKSGSDRCTFDEFAAPALGYGMAVE